MTASEAPHNLPSSRAEALATGARRYYTGKPCKAGHLEVRTALGDCMECLRQKQRARLADPVHKMKHSQWTLNRYHRKKGLPGFVENIRANAKVAASSAHRKLASAKSDARRYADPAERENMRLASSMRYGRLKDDPEFRRRECERGRYWRAQGDNMAKVLAQSKVYQMRKRGACPAWLTKDERRQMRAVYREARRLTLLTGVQHVVDHVMPLRGKTVCGLHVPWNLQILTEHENLVKGNKLTCT